MVPVSIALIISIRSSDHARLRILAADYCSFDRDRVIAVASIFIVVHSVIETMVVVAIYPLKYNKYKMQNINV